MQLLVIQIYPLEQAEGPANTVKYMNIVHIWLQDDRIKNQST